MAIDSIATNDYPYQAPWSIILHRNEAGPHYPLKSPTRSEFPLIKIPKANVNFADPCGPFFLHKKARHFARLERYL
jgi:hypothetical protein